MDRGGAETFIMNLFRAIDRNRFCFDFLAHQQREGAYEPEIRAMGGRIFRVPYVPEVGHTGYRKALHTFFSDNEYAVIHSHIDRMSGLVLEAAHDAGVPLRIAHGHARAATGGIAARAYKWLIGKKIPRHAQILLAASRGCAAWTFGSAGEQAQIIPNAIDVKTFAFNNKRRDDIRRELDIENHFVIGMIARIAPVKNHLFALEAFASCVTLRPEAVLLFIGDGPLRPAVEARAIELGIADKVRFGGMRKDITNILQALDVFILPSKKEGLPLSVLEAQASGLPCVLSHGVPEEVDMGAGLVRFAPLKTELWAREMIRECVRMPQASKYLSDRGYDISDATQRMERIYVRGGLKYPV